MTGTYKQAAIARRKIGVLGIATSRTCLIGHEAFTGGSSCLLPLLIPYVACPHSQPKALILGSLTSGGTQTSTEYSVPVCVTLVSLQPLHRHRCAKRRSGRPCFPWKQGWIFPGGKRTSFLSVGSVA